MRHGFPPSAVVPEISHLLRQSLFSSFSTFFASSCLLLLKSRRWKRMTPRQRTLPFASSLTFFSSSCLPLKTHHWRKTTPRQKTLPCVSSSSLLASVSSSFSSSLSRRQTAQSRKTSRTSHHRKTRRHRRSHYPSHPSCSSCSSSSYDASCIQPFSFQAPLPYLHLPSPPGLQLPPADCHHLAACSYPAAWLFLGEDAAAQRETGRELDWGE